MKKLLVSLAALAAVAGAQAATIVTVDNFDTGALTTGPVNNLSGNDGVRAIDMTYTSVLQNNSTASANDSDPGLLAISNGSNRDTQVIVTWTLPSFALPAAFTNAGFYFSVVDNDAVNKDISFSLDGINLADVTLNGGTLGAISLGVNNATLAAAAAGGTLVATINGGTGWDLSLDSFGFSFDAVVVPNPVPEPASLALVGLALAGIAAARRRKV